MLLRQLLRYHAALAYTDGSITRYIGTFWALVLSPPVGMIVGLLTSAAFEAVASPNPFRGPVTVAVFMPGVTVGILAGVACLIGLLSLFSRIRLGRSTEARERLKAKIDEIARVFPDETQFWGGPAMLHDPDQAWEIVRLVREGKA
jgi:hypothetical protein